MKQYIFVLFALLTTAIQGFAPTRQHQQRTVLRATDGEDPNEIVARRITVKGAVQGGYYRSCVNNEAGKFRRLVGTMSPPDESDEAEIYVEGKRKLMAGFIRWCKKGDVGLNQQAKVIDVKEEDPTGLYESFYVKTK
ncbi:unnamed protein product [Cylindrotheca closterium]|uniref:Acylphosphatase-like domain-containing protein n=1 Tax=Cylindrotheca closterium TaxID=2856 RepID=A0AAD2JKZ6_9STRA|nr:unnamed protein product [Cylindrotheca closterium]